MLLTRNVATRRAGQFNRATGISFSLSGRLTALSPGN